jgi:murein DD-endopeptidase MepM/ murein hydrolase activator NlpD
MLQQLIDLSMGACLLSLVALSLALLMRNRLIILFLTIGFSIAGVALITQPTLTIPVKNASVADWNAKSFWYEPWGNSIVHRGIDIFGKRGTPILSSTDSLIIFTGDIKVGGLVILAIDRSLRVHYYAHLAAIDTHRWKFVQRGDQIGRLGASGNAFNKPPHLHYSLLSIIPQPWEITSQTLGHLRAFYLNPIAWFE